MCSFCYVSSDVYSLYGVKAFINIFWIKCSLIILTLYALLFLPPLLVSK